MREFWLSIIVLAPVSGWMIGLLSAGRVRRYLLAVASAVPLIVFTASLATVSPGPAPLPWLIIGLGMMAIVELPWIGLTLIGFALRRGH